MKKAVYAGSFDPLTNGHLWMIEEGSRLFDELVLAIGINPDKSYTFSLDERVDMLRSSIRFFPNVAIDTFENQFLVNYASSVDARYILRGIRTQGDYEYERVMRYINSDLNRHIVTIFLMPPREIAEISSSLVKGLVGPDGWEAVVEGYLPRDVYNRFLIKFNGLKKRWDALWEQIGANNSMDEASYQELVFLYGQRHRAYHNLVHIAHALRELDLAGDFIGNQEQVEVAVWYHDAVYETRAKDNEEKSAELAEQRLGRAGLKKSFIDGVKALILATRHVDKTRDTDAQYLVDIDLSILGKPEDKYDEYERGIREEYGWLQEEQFRKGRSVILQGFLDRDNIYSTDFFRQRYEEQARKNLGRSIAKLQ